MTNSTTPLWQNKNFLVFWLGQALSVLGDGFAAIALPLLVLRATGSVTQMGAMTATLAAGRIAAALVAGIVADRWDRRSIMIVCDVVRALLMGLVPVMHFVSGISMPLIFVGVAIVSFSGTIFQVACFAALPALVGRERVVEVNSWLLGAYAVMGLVGPVLGGIACARFGPVLGIGVDAISFVISAVSLAFVTFRKADDSASETPTSRAEFTLASLLSGIVFIWRTPVLRAMAVGFAAIAFLVEARLDLIIYHLEHDTGANADRIGVVLGVSSLGALVAGFFARRIYETWGTGTTWFWMSLLASVPCVGIGLLGQTHGAWFIAGLLTMISFGETVRGIVSQSVRHYVTPDALLGRVTSAYWAIMDVPALLGAFVMTALAMHCGASMVFGVIGLGTLLVAMLTWNVLRRIPQHVLRAKTAHDV